MTVLSWIAVVIGFIVGAAALGHVASLIAGVVLDREIRTFDLVMSVVLAGVAALTSWGFLRVFEGRWHWLTGAATVWLILIVLLHLAFIATLNPGEDDTPNVVAHFVVAAILALSAAAGTVYLDNHYREVAEDNTTIEPHPLMSG